MRPPERLFRWVDDQQARSAVLSGCLVPSWRHLMPDSGKVERCLSFGASPTRWYESGQHTACLVVSTVGAAWADQMVAIDGEEVFRASCDYQGLTRAAADGGDLAKRYRRKAEAVAARSAMHFREVEPGDDVEWVLRKPVPDLRERLVAVFLPTCADWNLRRLLEEMAADGSLACPVRAVRSCDLMDRERAEAVMAEALAEAGPGRPGPGR